MSNSGDDRNEITNGLGICALILVGYLFLLNAAPHVLLVIPAVLIAAPVKWLMPWDQAAWTWIGTRLLMAVLAIAAIYVLLCVIGDVDVQLRRFLRGWKASGHDDALIWRHPWAVIPRAMAAVLVSASIVFIRSWRG